MLGPWLLSIPAPDDGVRLQVTFLLLAFVTVALIPSCVPSLIVCGVDGERETVIEDVCTAICTVAVTVELATEVAVIVTVLVVGTLAGAV